MESILEALAQYDVALAKKRILDGCDVNEADDNDRTVLHEAVQFDDGELVQMLIDRGADVNALDCVSSTPLHEAVSAGMVQNAALLLNNGAEKTINAKMDEDDECGVTALHEAVIMCVADAIPLLLKHGADPNITDSYGYTPADGALAVEPECPEVLSALKRCGVPR